MAVLNFTGLTPPPGLPAFPIGGGLPNGRMGPKPVTGGPGFSVPSPIGNFPLPTAPADGFDRFGRRIGGTIPGLDLPVEIDIPGLPVDIDLDPLIDRLFGGGDPDPMGDPSVPGGGFAPTGGGPCWPGFSRDPITGQCVLDWDPGAGQGLPGGNGAAGTGLNRPRATSRTVLQCPRFADGKTGVLWMNALTGDVVCLPRRTSGRGFGLIRKNKPRKRAYISAAEKASLTKMKRVQERAKEFATDAGFTCKKR